MVKNIGLTSRGSEDEQEFLIADILHQEQHLIETLTKEPHRVEELTEQVDNLRRINLKNFKKPEG